jgi:glycosyltransferase involved in cell wall biosynthesis
MINSTEGLVQGLTIVIPCFNEADNVPALAQEIEQSLSNLTLPWECIWVDDGSTDETWSRISSLGKPHIGLRMRRNTGQSTSIMAGIDVSAFEWIVTIDGDGQNDPSDIPFLVSQVTDQKNVICGFRKFRKDNFFLRKLPSRLANSISRILLRVPVRDLGCTLRVFNRNLLLQTRLMGEQHRVLTVYLSRNGGQIKEFPVKHRPRTAGASKYGLSRVLKFIGDLILVRFYQILMSKPLYFFGTLSVFSICIFVISMFLNIFVFFLGARGHFDSSLVSLSLLSAMMSLSFLSFGLICEVLIRTRIDFNRSAQYEIQEISRG